jgi:hypothetical protein
LRRDSLLVLGLMIALCLLGGLVFGVATGRWAHSGAASTRTPVPPTPTPSAVTQPAPSGEQKSLLIVGVDDASAAQPAFEGCWVLSFRPGIPEYYFSSFPPDSTFKLASLSKVQTLAEIYRLDQQQQLGFQFMRDAIESRFPALQPQAEVVIDRRALAALVTQAGGLSVDGRSLNGQQLLDTYADQASQGMPERMAFQETVVRALFSRLAERHWTPEGLIPYFEQFPGSRAAQLDSFAAGAPPLAASGIHWTVFTPELETAGTP